MAFRSDRDALLARADALQREHDRLEHELSGAASERDELRAALAKNEKELVRLRRKVAPTPADLAHRAQKTKILVAVAAAVIVVAVGLVAALSVGTAKIEPPEQPRAAVAQAAVAPQPVAPPVVDLAETKENQLDRLRSCLTGADLDLRGFAVGPGTRSDPMLLQRLEGCEERLRAILANAGPVESFLPTVEAYADAFAAWRALAMQLMRYYGEDDDKDDANARGRALHADLDPRRAAAIAASDELRARAAPL
ncbi:MAG TPA: hypothetical protein VML75_11155, partial [Kofleriaceae bacterium]|nr:hypothetical protein [Kofleriaceae bacterium]